MPQQIVVLLRFASLAGPLLIAAASRAQQSDKADPLATIEDRLQAAYKQVVPATVRFAYGDENKLQFGTGVIVTPEGHIATCGPVQSVIDDKLLQLVLSDGRRVNGKALGWSHELGLGLLKITDEGTWPYVEFARSAAIRPGQLCFAIGYPQPRDSDFDDRSPSIRLGAVTKSAPPLWLTSSYRFKAGAHCVFDLDGRLLGLTCITPEGGDAIQTNAAMIKTHWDDLIAGKNLDRARLASDQAEAGQPSAAASQPQSQTSEAFDTAALDKAKAATVRIADVEKPPGLASGVIVTADGYIITCAHHQRMPGQQLNVALADGRDARATVLGTNLVSDVGLLKITGDGPWPHVAMGNSASLHPGDKCVLIGYPRERPGREPWLLETKMIEPTYTLPAKDPWDCQFWTADFPKSHGGASGGGVFDARGRVVGVILGGVSDEMQHARVELFRKQWDLLAARKSVLVLDSQPQASISSEFSNLAAKVPSCAVEVLVDHKPRALGTIVSSDGRIVTKASVLKGTVSCRLANGQELLATVSKLAREHDLAVLKIDALELPEARWREGDAIVPGTLLAAVIPRQKIRTGIVTVPPQSRQHATGDGAGTARPDDRHQEHNDLVFGTDILLTPELCGGPVIDRTGRAVGILIRCHTEYGGFGQSEVIPANVVRKVALGE